MRPGHTYHLAYISPPLARGDISPGGRRSWCLATQPGATLGMEGGGLSEQRGCLSPAQRKGLWAMRGLRRVAELTFKAMRVMNKGSWTSGQEEEVRMSGFPPQSREKGVFCFLLQFPLFMSRSLKGYLHQF